MARLTSLFLIPLLLAVLTHSSPLSYPAPGKANFQTQSICNSPSSPSDSDSSNNSSNTGSTDSTTTTTPPPFTNPSGAGNNAGTQFITGVCLSDRDCASGCCGFNTGKCAGAIIALERDGGCGFGDGAPNDDAARWLRGQA
ncbi:hypothetical protein EX30DRAFT_341315 [Ascodesmis nigricans]|uniref:Biotrophy-associated secreted protein 2 n=1 Tax=Ascodesmis nigricans TaxID=341454 RepID=A0A4S2MVP9_9PEZI|nr:hypothetical protein EX30DRAFT_341315 [Ascodesmis nigricans]